MPHSKVALVYPPLWYYTTVPADLSYTAGFLRGNGVEVGVWDLSAKLSQDLLGAVPAFAALQDPKTYTDPRTRAPAMDAIRRACADIRIKFGVRYRVRSLTFPGIIDDSVASARRVGLDPHKNPAYPTLQRAAEELASGGYSVVAIALVYPEQRVHLLALARLLREAGYSGHVVVYGSLQDEIAPLDFAEDFVRGRRHALFEDVEGALLGDPEPGLLTLATEGPVGAANLFWADTGVLPARVEAPLTDHPGASFKGIDPSWYCTPTPVVDLRMGRGCPWARCAFCAIQAHHTGYRAGTVRQLIHTVRRAHTTLGSTYFRIRDDLITPRQLREISAAIASLPFTIHWTARARFQGGFTKSLLSEAARAGLDELWMGLESANDTVRRAMIKGVSSQVIEQILTDAHTAGIRVRALCMVGFPGETLAQANETVDFLVRKLDVLDTASLSPFQLMRRSPMAQNPNDYGIHLGADPLPAFDRLRFTVPASWPQPSPAEISRLVQRVAHTLGPRLQAQLCPDASHGWLRTNAQP